VSSAQADKKFRRNLFEIDNAKSLRREELVATFVPTQAYWRLLSAKNHVVLGARGSGKTALVKMLSHDHMSAWQDDRAKQVVDNREFIGVYVPMDLEWVGTLRRPWLSESESERFFQWRLNVALAHAQLGATASCLRRYVSDLGDRALREETLCRELGELWLEDASPGTIPDLKLALNRFTARRLQQLERSHVGNAKYELPHESLAFDTPLLSPFRRAIEIVQRRLDIPGHATWIVSFDEAEFLEPHHLRMINTVMRSHLGNVAIKVTTMPYFYSAETNAKVSLDAGHDFDYVNVDRDPVTESAEFARRIFDLRRAASPHPSELTIDDLLGPSELLDAVGERDAREFLRRLLPNVNGVTASRAIALSEDDPIRFRDQIVRKLAGAITLRDAVGSAKGNRALTVYSGVSMVIRCSDGNPRRLVGLYNELLQAFWKLPPATTRPRRPLLPRTVQSRVLTTFSKNALLRSMSIEEIGPDVYAMLMRVGEYMRSRLHDNKLGTDTISSVIVDQGVDDETWRLVRAAAGRGLMYSNTSQMNPEPWPDRDGVFHLAYVLAPHFRLLPRRGKAVRLSRVVSGEPAPEIRESKSGQLSIFDG
jgi:hypothetical protein